MPQILVGIRLQNRHTGEILEVVEINTSPTGLLTFLLGDGDIITRADIDQHYDRADSDIPVRVLCFDPGVLVLGSPTTGQEHGYD